MRELLITGGAGFIGVNAAEHFSRLGWRVTVLDNLSRKGARDNLEWLRQQAQISFEHADIRDNGAVERIIAGLRPDMVLHLAAQVAVTTSVANPREDFEINALGTFNLLDALRRESPSTFFLNASTNKVYGKMDDVPIVERDGRYGYDDLTQGVSETRPLDFHSPYGCSKGVADQYTLDFPRIYGLQTTTFRQSCIYGPRQFGVEDQGWVAWFAIAATLGRTITIYGDGKQVRDVLHVSDLCRAYESAFDNRDRISGEAFNIGGGPANTLSLLELVKLLEEEGSLEIDLAWDAARPGDQPVFICDISKARHLLDWEPRVRAREGVRDLAAWVRANRSLFGAPAPRPPEGQLQPAGADIGADMGADMGNRLSGIPASPES